MAELDDRWEWLECPELGKAESTWIRGRCYHLEIVPVTLALTGEEVATLCATCDAELPPFTRSPDPRSLALMARLDHLADTIASDGLLA